MLRHVAGPKLYGLESPLGLLELTFSEFFCFREKELSAYWLFVIF